MSLVNKGMQKETSVCYASHPLGWLESERQIMSGVGEDGRKSEPSHAAQGNINWCRCCGGVGQFFNRLSSYCDPAFPLIGIYPREMKTCPHKDLYFSVHSSIIHNSPKVETTQVSIN